MKTYFVFIFLCILYLAPKGFSQSNNICLPNKDKQYIRLIVLDSMCKYLNYSSVFYQLNNERGSYKIHEENFYNFYICDLTNIKNQFPYKTDCIEFTNNHIYLFSDLSETYFVANIMVLMDGNFYFFLGLNCINKIHTTKQVLEWVKLNMKNKVNKNVLKRIKNYKMYKRTIQTDDEKIKCECDN